MTTVRKPIPLMCLPANLLSSEQAGNHGSESTEGGGGVVVDLCVVVVVVFLFFFACSSPGSAVQVTLPPYHLSVLLFPIQPFLLLFVRLPLLSAPIANAPSFFSCPLLGFHSRWFTIYSSCFFDSMMGRCEVRELARKKYKCTHTRTRAHAHSYLHYKA